MGERFDALHQRIRADRVAQHDDVLHFLARVILWHDHHHVGLLAKLARQLLPGHIRQAIRRQQHRPALRGAHRLHTRVHNAAGHNLRGEQHAAEFGGHALRRGDVKTIGK